MKYKLRDGIAQATSLRQAMYGATRGYSAQSYNWEPLLRIEAELGPKLTVVER